MHVLRDQMSAEKRPGLGDYGIEKSLCQAWILHIFRKRQAIVPAYENPDRKDSGAYKVSSSFCEGQKLQTDKLGRAVLPRRMLDTLSGGRHRIIVKLN